MKKSKMNYFLMDNFKESNIKSFRTELLRIQNHPNFDCGNWMNNESLSESFCEIIETNFKFSTLQQQIFNELNFKGIDTGYFIDDSGFPDDDSFEEGKFAYITQSSTYDLLLLNRSSICYGLGEDEYSEKKLINLEKSIINILKKSGLFKKIIGDLSDPKSIYVRYRVNPPSMFYGMQGNEVSFVPDFQIFEYFNSDEILELTRILKTWHLDDY